MGSKETRAYLKKCINRLALGCPFGFAAGRNRLCVCVCVWSDIDMQSQRVLPLMILQHITQVFSIVQQELPHYGHVPFRHLIIGKMRSSGKLVPLNIRKVEQESRDYPASAESATSHVGLKSYVLVRDGVVLAVQQHLGHVDSVYLSRNVPLLEIACAREFNRPHHGRYTVSSFAASSNVSTTSWAHDSVRQMNHF